MAAMSSLAMASDFHGQSRNTAAIKDALERIARAGFSHVHWCHEFGNSPYEYSIYEMLQIKEWCREFGLLVKGVHAAHAGEKTSDLKDFLSSNEYNRLAGVELIHNRIEMAYNLGTDNIVLHFMFPWERLEKEIDRLNELLQPAFRSFDELEPYCKARGIKICVENTHGTMAQFCTVFDVLCKRYSNDFLGLCFDTGHAVLHCKDSHLEFAQRYNDRLFMMHGADNHGERDEHLLPFEGIFDWEGFASVLARSPYCFPIVLEPSCKVEGDDSD